MIITKTPFRISFVGGGSDMKSFYQFHNGKVLSSTIDKYIYVVVRKQLGIVEFKYRVNWSQTELSNSINSIEHPVVREALKYFKIKYPIEITTFSDIPSNTGLASSSAFAVGLVHALLILQKKKFTKHTIATIAAKLEVEILKRNVGKQDHFACSYGGFNKITFYKNEKVKISKINLKKKIVDKLKSNLKLYYTSIKRNASTILEDQKKLNKHQMKNLMTLVNLVNPTIKILKSKEKNLNLIGITLHKNWEIKRLMSKKITSKLIDRYYFKAIKAGASGGKILGAGNGGFFLFYVNEKNQRNFKNLFMSLKKLDFNFEKKGTTVVFNDQN